MIAALENVSSVHECVGALWGDILAHSVDLIEEEWHVLHPGSLALKGQSEEVWKIVVFQGLLLDHYSALVLHLFEDHLMNLRLSIISVLCSVFSSEAWWGIPEVDVGCHWLADKLPFTWIGSDAFGKILGFLHGVVSNFC